MKQMTKEVTTRQRFSTDDRVVHVIGDLNEHAPSFKKGAQRIETIVDHDDVFCWIEAVDREKAVHRFSRFTGHCIPCRLKRKYCAIHYPIPIKAKKKA